MLYLNYCYFVVASVKNNSEAELSQTHHIVLYFQLNIKISAFSTMIKLIIVLLFEFSILVELQLFSVMLDERFYSSRVTFPCCSACTSILLAFHKVELPKSGIRIRDKRHVPDIPGHKRMIVHQFVFADDVTLSNGDVPRIPMDPEDSRLVTIQQIRLHGRCDLLAVFIDRGPTQKYMKIPASIIEYN